MSDTDDEPEEIDYDASTIPAFEAHATAIGYICLHWAHLEQVLNATLELLIPMTERELSRCLTSNIEFRAKIQIAITLGYKRNHREEWFKALQEHLNHIDNNLRPERNRMIHDTWDWTGPEIIRRQYATRLTKPQAFKPQTLTVEHPKPVPVEEMWTLVYRIDEASSELALLNNEYVLFGPSPPK